MKILKYEVYNFYFFIQMQLKVEREREREREKTFLFKRTIKHFFFEFMSFIY